MVVIMSKVKATTQSRNLIESLLGPFEENLHSHSTQSIHQRLQKFFNSPDKDLDPSPTLNSILTDLVSYLQGNSFSEESLYPLVELEACQVIDQNENLLCRADDIRRLAIRAETRMEFYYSKELTIARQSSMKTSNLSFVDRVKIAAELFPYTDNYIQMVDVESDVLKWFYKVVGRNGRMHIVFCGSGPLPFTGLLLAMYLDADVTLIDCCPDAIEASKKLTKRWEDLGIIPSGKVDHLCIDGADIQFIGRGKTKNVIVQNQNQKFVSCDIVFMAALIPNKVKEKMAQNVSDLGRNGPLVLLRSAHGLTSRFAYYRTRRSVLTEYLKLVGVLTPKSHYLGDGKIVDDTEKPMELFPSTILNSLELYASDQFTLAKDNVY